MKTYGVTINNEATSAKKRLLVRRFFNDIIKDIPEKTQFLEVQKKYTNLVYSHINNLNRILDDNTLLLSGRKNEYFALREKTFNRIGVWNDVLRKKLRPYKIKIEFDNGTILYLPNDKELIKDYADKFEKIALTPANIKTKKPVRKVKRLPTNFFNFVLPKSKISIIELKDKSPKNMLKEIFTYTRKDLISRFVINGVYVTPDVMVATDGRYLFKLYKKGAFESIAPEQNIKDETVVLGINEDKIIGEFPMYDSIIPLDNFITIFDPQIAYQHMKQAILVADECSGGVDIYLNPNKTLGFVSVNNNIGTAEVNVKNDSQFIVAINPKQFINVMKTHIRFGSKQLTLHVEKSDKPIKFVGTVGDTSALVPVDTDKKFREKYIL